MHDYCLYRIARNFFRTLFSKISETSGIFQFFLQTGALNFFKPVANKEKGNQKFQNIFLNIH